MIAIERGKLIPVNGDNDSPDLENAIDVQFNPVTLKVSLSNTLKENARNGNSRAAQFVDKSSSNLTIELIFDTTYIEQPSNNQGGGDQTASSAGSNSSSKKAIEQGSDVRLQTKKIADTFIKPVAEGDKLKAPKRCLFQWGAFEFLGLVQSFDETLDFFSPEGRPLRAVVSLKLSEDRYQFRNRDVAQAARNTPSLSSTGANPQGGDQNAGPVPGGSGDGAGNWRDTSMFNGIETPRMPSLAVVAVPSFSMSASLGISGGAGFGLGAGVNISGGFGVSVSTSLSATVSSGGSASGSASSGVGVKPGQQPPPSFSPAFKFGNSASLGTGIEGAFSPTGKTASLNAASLQTGSVPLRAGAAQTGIGGQLSQFGAAVAGGQPLSTAAANQAGLETAGRKSSGVSVAGLKKAAADTGVGFD